GFGFITFVDPASVDRVLATEEHELDGKKNTPYVYRLVAGFVRSNLYEFACSGPSMERSCDRLFFAARMCK
ncbi:hypothetical protein ANCDUO_21387, partial [Ancylostoma duodenale]